MQVVKQYPDGVFSWVDLGTTDTESAKTFYGGLFGWSFLDIPTDSGVVYSMAQIEGYNVAGLGPLDPSMQEQSIPTHWSAYVKHDDVDAVAGKASEAGGTVLSPAGVGGTTRFPPSSPIFSAEASTSATRI